VTADRVLILTEDTHQGDETGAGRMRNRCAFTSRDMGADWPEAFTYAVVLGWDAEDDEEDPMPEMAARWGWDDEMVAFLRETHQRFQQLVDRRTAS